MWRYNIEVKGVTLNYIFVLFALYLRTEVFF